VIEDKDRYAAIIQLIVVAETTSWNRFYNFLMFASVLIVAWAAIYSQSTPPKGATFIMASISVFGFISGFAWGGLGWRGRAMQKIFVDEGKKLEERTPGPAEGQPPHVNPCAIAAEKRDSMKFSKFSSFYLLIGVPILCGLLFLLLLVPLFR